MSDSLFFGLALVTGVAAGLGALTLVALWESRQFEQHLGDALDLFVDTVACTYCDEPIVPEREDGDTAFECSCGSWHHYDCATNCSSYLDGLEYSYREDVLAEDRWSR